MKRPRRRWWVAAVGVLLVAGAGGYGFRIWRRAVVLEDVIAHRLPAVPDLAGQPAPLQQRIAAGEKRIREDQDATAAIAELAGLYHANGFYGEAEACYLALMRVQPREARWPHRLGALLAGFGDIERALPLAERAVDLAPDYGPARLRFADLLLKNNRFEKAAETYRALLARDPDDRHAQFGLARCDFELGRWEEARVRLEELVAETGYRLGYDLIVTVYERLGRTDAAASIRGRERASGAYRDPPDPWMDALMDHCYDPYRLSMLAGSLAESGDTAGAVRRLEQAITLSPRSHALHFQLATLHLRFRAYDKARQGLETCLRLAPEFPDAYAYLSDLLQTVGDRAGAERTLAEGLRRCPTSPGLHLMQARRLHQEGQVDAAIAEFRRSIELRPNEAEASIELARLLIKADRLGEARTELERALVAEPSHPAALSILAFDAITQGDRPRAESFLRQLQRQPRVSKEQLTSLLDAFRARFGLRFE